MTTSDGLSNPVTHGQSNSPRGEGNAPRELSREVLRNLLHPKEPARAGLVWASAGFTALVLLLLIAGTLGVFIVIVAGVAVTIWLAKQLAYALFRGNAVEIGPAQFSDIHKRIVEAERRLGLTQRVAGFVVRDGELNAFFYRKSGRKVLVLNSTMVEDMSMAELDFIILRFLGYLRARQVDLGSIAWAVDLLKTVPILGLLTRSYDRAAVLSGDRIGAYACESTDTARSAMAKFAVGAKLQPRFSAVAYLSQAQGFRQSPWNLLARLWRDYPHFSDRMIELETWIDDFKSRAS